HAASPDSATSRSPGIIFVTAGTCPGRHLVTKRRLDAMSDTGYIREPERQVPVRGDYEVVVLGGGPAGIAAAAAAAGAGRRTLLVERYGFLGGMGTAAGVTNFCGLFAN